MHVQHVQCLVESFKAFSYHHAKPESHHHMKKKGRTCLIQGCELADSGTLCEPRGRITKKKKEQYID